MASSANLVLMAGLALAAHASPGEAQAVDQGVEGYGKVHVRVVTSAGEPISGATVEAFFLGEVVGSVGYCASFSDHHVDTLPTGRDGIAEVIWPLEGRDLHTLTLMASAPGHAKNSLGDAVGRRMIGSELTIVLSPGRALRGRVLFQGKPVAGAQVDVRQVRVLQRPQRSRNVARLATPFDVRAVAPERELAHRTDDEGRYVLTLPTVGDYTVRVEAKGHPVALRGPFQEPGSRELDVELANGGAIEGRMLLPEGNAPEWRWVGAARGWNVVHTAQVATDGHFRIEGLEPGAYQVRECEGALQPLQIAEVAAWRRTDRTPVWDCIVRSGETTRFDLDLRSPESVVTGRFVAPGIPVVRAQLHDADHELLGRAELGPDGSFRLSAPVVGAGWVALSSGFGTVDDDVSIRLPCSLAPGVNVLEHLETGTLVLRGGAPRNDNGTPCSDLAVRADRDDLWYRILVRVHGLDRTGEVRVRLPAGEARVTPFGAPGRTLHTIHVPAGGETIVRFGD